MHIQAEDHKKHEDQGHQPGSLPVPSTERERESERERYAMHRDAGGWVGAGAVDGITTGHDERGAASEYSWGAGNCYGTTDPDQGWPPSAERDMGQRSSAGVLTNGGEATHEGGLIYGGGAHANSMLHAPAPAPGPSTRPPGSRNFVGGFESHSHRADARFAQGAPVCFSGGGGGGQGARADGSQVLWAGLVVCALTSSICSDLQDHYDIRLHPSLMKQVLKFHGVGGPSRWRHINDL
jgi:hypothetical protein